MPPSNPWGKKPQEKGAAFPELKPAKSNDAQLKYEEIQENELLVLPAVYGDDFRLIETNQGAWKKSEPCFEIRIQPDSKDEDIAMTLRITFTATYPRTAPLLSIKNDDGLKEGTRFKIQNILKSKPKELSEEPMIVEIVSACQGVLDDAIQAKAEGLELPSLEEERAAHEAAAAQLAREQREEEEKKKQLESMEEERMMGSLIQDQLRRQRAKAKETKRKNRPPGELGIDSPIDEPAERSAPHEQLIFDHPVSHVDANGNPFVFQAVIGKVPLRRGPVSHCFTVRPAIPRGIVSTPTLVLKQTDLDTGVKDHNLFKKQLQLLETELELLKKIRHQNILEILDFKVHKTIHEKRESDSEWTVSVLSEFAEKGSLEEFLDIAGNLNVNKARSWTIELLDALRFLHDHGIIHEDIHAGNILLVRNSVGDVKPKLSEPGYQRKLHNLSSQRHQTSKVTVAKSAYWLPAEVANADKPQYTQKTDVWDFGILFLQMIFGLNVIEKYSSPTALADSLSLSDSLDEFVHKFFKADPKKRPRAFELSSSEFLATDAPILDDSSSAAVSRLGSTNSLLTPVVPRKQRQDSIGASSPFSRYQEDFVEEGRLGKGSYGEVVKARKKLDGQIYAIKKITQKSSASLTKVLKEVRLLSQLSHPSVVRYYNTWTEEVPDITGTDDDLTNTDDASEDFSSELSPGNGPNVEFGASTGGLDFMSSNGYTQEVEFGHNTDSEEEDEDDEDDDGDESTSADDPGVNNNGKEQPDLGLNRTRSSSRFQRTFRTVLYISMEYCEKRTLSDLIKRGLYKDTEEIWRLFRQILEGLAHIHGLNVVHRDLKPDNIFIDAASNVRIGDFGLATSEQYTVSDKASSAAAHISGDLTKNIGTASYVAPEVRSAVSGVYGSKVDMYSLGIIFFEMCYQSVIGTERVIMLEGLRTKQPAAFPSDFDVVKKPVQADIVQSLLNHSPKERPSAIELLRSGKLPVQMESETIRQALAGLSDSKSPYYHKMMSALFSRPTLQAKDYAWDMGTINPSAGDLLLQGLVKQKLTSIFRNHGAVETSRTAIFPRSGHYGPNAVQLLDPNGTLLQLPFDLTLPHARAIAKHEPSVQRSFAFGAVYRDKHDGATPQTFGEVDFDIISSDSLDLALKEAEVIKVLDEIVTSFPALSTTQMCFHINHSDLLNLIFEFCGIEPSVRQATADSLSKLNVQQWTWQKIRAELRSPLIGLSAMSLDDLQRFDFRDTPNKAFQKLKTIFEGTDIFEKASSTFAHLRDVIDYIKRFDVRSKIYISPLGSLKEKFCKGGVLFSCMYDRKTRDVFAAGGRYDSLIREHRHRTGSHSDERHAVGFNLAWEKLARIPKQSAKAFLKKPEEEIQGIWTTKRCEVLIASHDPAILRTTGVDIVQSLWANDISAELARDSHSPEDLLSKYRDDSHSFIIIIKQDSVLKIKSMARKDVPDADIPSTQLMGWLRVQIQERDHKDGIYHRSRLQRGSSQADAGASTDREQEVRVLVAGTKSKKSNRRNIVEQAQGRAGTLIQSFFDGPIAAIETSDFVIDLIRETKLSDPESWRKVSQNVPMAERRYIGEVHDLISGLAHQNKGITRNAFVYNFRTGTCIYYDLSA